MPTDTPPQITPLPGKQVTIRSTGASLPDRILTNADLEKMVETSDEWITTRTGIRERRLASPEQAASDLATEAAQTALSRAGVPAGDVELIIVATITPDMLFPSTACLVQQNIGAFRALAFDIEAACSGFIYGLEIARQFLQAGTVSNALVIGAEKLSSIIDWTDRNTCVLFGDGAGAAFLTAEPAETPQSAPVRGILSSELGADGTKNSLLAMPGGGSRCPATPDSLDSRLHFLKMDGKETFKNAIQAMTGAARRVLESAGLEVSDIRWIVPHQANQRILTAVGEKVGAEPHQLFMNVQKYGNTSAASIGIALDELASSNQLMPGDKVLLLAFGAGLTWAAMIIEW